MKIPEHGFLKIAARILNSGQTRTLLLTGAIHDLFGLAEQSGVRYVPLTDLLAASWKVPNRIIVVYELNGPIRFINPGDRDRLKNAWLRWRHGLDSNQLALESMISSKKIRDQLDTMARAYDEALASAVGSPTVAMELLRQMCLCSRSKIGSETLLAEDLIVIIEAADLLLPEGEITALGDADRHRLAICQDWFSDPGFMNGGDSVVLIAESRSLLNRRVARLPQVIDVPAPSPGEEARAAFIEWFRGGLPQGTKLETWGTDGDLVRATAGLSIHALRQLLVGASHDSQALSHLAAVQKVEEFIQSQLGEDIVEFKKPSHKIDDLIGFTRLKGFLRDELIPRFRASGPEALPGAAVGGPIGGGKTYIFEAVAGELDMVVLVLKNIRSQWYGQTDVIFERLRRVLDALSKVLIFVDEADTQFGGVGADTHETERRLTGKVQAMMSDPRLRGKVVWLLMTARIHLLSPDIRRPGRVGDLIIPVLDPEGEDRDQFIRWAAGAALKGKLTDKQLKAMAEKIGDYSAAAFASLRSELKARAIIQGGPLTFDQTLAVIDDHLQPAIGDTRKYQALQALINCTRRSLLPDPAVSEEQRQAWEAEVRHLEAKGVR